MWGIKTASNLSPLDGFSSSFGFFFGVSFWMEDDLWLQREDTVGEMNTEQEEQGKAWGNKEKEEAQQEDRGQEEGPVSPLLPQSRLLLWTQTPTQSVKNIIIIDNNNRHTTILTQQHQYQLVLGATVVRKVRHTCDGSCCGGGAGGVGSVGPSRRGRRRSWRSQSPSSAPWSSATRDGTTAYTASIAAYRPPTR